MESLSYLLEALPSGIQIRVVHMCKVYTSRPSSVVSRKSTIFVGYHYYLSFQATQRSGHPPSLKRRGLPMFQVPFYVRHCHPHPQMLAAITTNYRLGVVRVLKASSSRLMQV